MSATIAETLANAKLQAPKPQPLPSGMPSVADFTPALLPDSLAERCSDIAERMQCAPEFPAIGAMVALGSLIGREAGIHPKRRDDWLVVPNLWGCVVGRPSVLKSPALQEAIAPLARLEVQAKEEHEQARREYDEQQIMAGLRLDMAKSEAKKLLRNGDGASAEDKLRAAKKAADEMGPPTLRRYRTNDATVEKLGELLAENPRGLLLFRDELSGWLAGLDKEGREAERSFFLEAFNGTGSFTYDRIGRGTVHIDACTVSLLGSTQPGKIGQYVRHALKGGAGDDGLMQRFQLMAWPDRGDWRHVDRWPDNKAKARAFDVYKYLADMNAEQIGAIKGEYEHLPALRFDDAGQDLFNEWYIDLMQRIRGDDVPAYLESHLAKYASLMPSLALIIHLAEYGTGPVPEYAAKRAAAWCEYLESHAKRVYAPGIMADELAARELGKRIKHGDIGPRFTLRELYRKGWGSLSTPEEARGAAQVLEEFDWLSMEQETGPDGGRPTTTYAVNPRIKEVAQ